MSQAVQKKFTAETPLKKQKIVLTALVEAAKTLKKDELFKTHDAALQALEAKLDQEYLAKVPPFKPDVFEGRKQATDKRVVLLELFTGAQCPPCVAADVAFDALLTTYKPTELIALQYHLHIPGPDPLTSPAAEARGEYDVLDGTPSLYFNGLTDAPGGGGMGASQAKYKQTREVVDRTIEGAPRAEIKLIAQRTGNKVQIQAAAQSLETGKAGEDAKAGDLVLRLVLTEESVRYQGGNGVRFHHHVVRDFPGGVAGTALKAGKCDVNLTLDLDQVREGLSKYLTKFAEEYAPFPQLPSIALEDISVVAFVQNNNDKSVWHAVTVKVQADKK